MVSFFGLVFGKLQRVSTRLIYGVEKPTTKMTFYSLIDRDMIGKEVSMSTFAGSVLLVVNVASNCGLTKQNYTELPQLYDQYSSRGLKILAFPCNQFGAQEPGSHEEIIQFVKKFDPQMPEKLVFFEKADVNGANTREVFSFLKKELPLPDGSVDALWNFSKFLVDHEGSPYKRYDPKVSPFAMKEDVEILLRRKEGSA